MELTQAKDVAGVLPVEDLGNHLTLLKFAVVNVSARLRCLLNHLCCLCKAGRKKKSVKCKLGPKRSCLNLIHTTSQKLGHTDSFVLFFYFSLFNFLYCRQIPKASKYEQDICHFAAQKHVK